MNILERVVLMYISLLEYCGGPNRLNAYSYDNTLRNGTSNNSTSITSSVTSSSYGSATASLAYSTSTSPVTVRNSTSFTYLGCYTDSTANRALIGLANPAIAAQNSVENCAIGCNQYLYFGVEYGAECYCGNEIAGGSALAPGSTTAETQCVCPLTSTIC